MQKLNQSLRGRFARLLHTAYTINTTVGMTDSATYDLAVSAPTRGGRAHLSIRLAIAHLFARTRDIRPLFLEAARPMKVEW